jgi:predicted TPR repeat methyltransferase
VAAGKLAKMMDDAHAQLQAGRARVAESRFQSVIAEFPEAADAYFQLAILRYDDQDLQGAVQYFQSYLKLEPNVAEVHFNVGTLLTALKRSREAIVAFQHALRLQPDLAEAHNNLGILYRDLGELTQAEQHFREAIEINPKFVAAVVNLGTTLTRQRAGEETLEVCRKACELNPELPEAHLALGLALEQEGRSEEAEHVLAEAARLRPDSVIWRYHLAAARGLAPPAAAPEEYVANLFDAYAPRFDEHLLGRLQYRTPERIASAIRDCVDRRSASALDLGCGTGLCGEVIRSMVDRLEGIDLSAGMIEQASQRGCYDDLVVSGISDFLEAKSDEYDLIVSSDVFIYIGDLTGTFARVAKALRPGGHFVFSVEAADEASDSLTPDIGYRLNSTRRYSHSLNYLQRLANEHRLIERHVVKEVLRIQAGEDVFGWIVALQKSE